MDIEANLWTTCLVLMETTARPPDPPSKHRIEDRTDREEIAAVVRPRSGARGGKRKKAKTRDKDKDVNKNKAAEA